MFGDELTLFEKQFSTLPLVRVALQPAENAKLSC